MRGLPRARWIAGAAVLALAVTACGGNDDNSSNNNPSNGTSTTAAAVTGGTFRVYLGEPAFLLPPNTQETEGGKVLSTLYSPLVDYDTVTGDPYPVVASEMPTSDDQKTWTIKVADGWTFTNGEPVTAQSFVDSWNYSAYGPNAANNGYFFGPGMADFVGYADVQSGADPDGDGAQTAPPPAATTMSGLKAIDDSTIQVELTLPFSQFPLMLGYTAFYPLAKACIADISACNETPIGNGPFKIDGKWDHNQSIHVVRNDAWPVTPAPNLDEIDFQIYADPDTGYLDLKAGDLDYSGVPSTEIANAKNDFPDHLIDQASPSFSYIGFPLWNPAFGGTPENSYGGQQKADLRHALSMAINRQEIIDTIFDGRFTPADSLVNPVVAGYRKGACGEFCTYDVEAAKQLFDSSGGVPGNSVNLWFNAGAGHDEWMTAVGNYWSTAFGLNYKLQERPWAEYLSAQSSHTLDGPFRLGWVMDYPSAQNFIAPIYGEGAGEGNFGYNNAEANQLMTEGNAATTLEEGIAKYNQAEDLILADFPNIPLWYGRVLAAYSDNVVNIQVDKFGNPDWTTVSVDTSNG